MAAMKYKVGDSVWCGGRKGKVAGKIPGGLLTIVEYAGGEVHHERTKDLSATKNPKKKK